MPPIDADQFLKSCRRTANQLVSHPAVGRHDLAGQIFNRLVANRKFLATYYTSIPAATILAGLALAPDKWPEVDWWDIDAIRKLVVLDPACGTGTLLMSSYQQIVENHRRAVLDKGSTPDLMQLHQALVEDSIHGADVVDAGIHLTASTLASMSPEVKFQRMNLSVFPLDFDPIEGARLGSLEWMSGDAIQATFSGAGAQIGPTAVRESTFVQRPQPKLVIANPPYTRSTGNDGDERRVFGHKPDVDEDALSARLSSLISNTPAHQQAGLASVFIVLADQMLADNGWLAFVLPATALSGVRWRKIREHLTSHYTVEFVISLHDPEDTSLSYDTSVAEVLVIAKKRKISSQSASIGRFVNLWRKPIWATEAIALTRAIQRISQLPVQSIDGPPDGGTDVMLGNDKWGEVVDGPLGASRWTGERWKQAECGQRANSLAKGILWDSNSKVLDTSLPITTLNRVAGISPSHLQIKGGYGGDRGAFSVSKGWDRQVRYSALWHVESKKQRSLLANPNARMSPRSGVNPPDVWDYSGSLHVTPDIGYASQRVAAVSTALDTLGVRMWHTLQINVDQNADDGRFEFALNAWINSSLGLLLHANHAVRSQAGRGLGSLTMLRSLPTLDVRKLKAWQLEAAEGIFMELRDAKFKPFYKCAIDPVRIRLDEILVRDVLGLGDDGIDAVARIRELLSFEPSIYGKKKPAPPRLSKLL